MENFPWQLTDNGKFSMVSHWKKILLHIKDCSSCLGHAQGWPWKRSLARESTIDVFHTKFFHFLADKNHGDTIVRRTAMRLKKIAKISRFYPGFSILLLYLSQYDTAQAFHCHRKHDHSADILLRVRYIFQIVSKYFPDFTGSYQILPDYSRKFSKNFWKFPES